MSRITNDTEERMEITDASVAAMANLAGIDLSPLRLPLVVARLREMIELAGELDRLDLADSEPDVRFDPSWPAEIIA